MTRRIVYATFAVPAAYNEEGAKERARQAVAGRTGAPPEHEDVYFDKVRGCRVAVAWTDFDNPRVEKDRP